MKKLTLLLLCIFTSRLAWADDVAVMSIKFPNEKKIRHQVVIEFRDAEAPVTVENFKKLARKDFYDDLTFHRVFPHILLQTGDPFSEKEKNRSKAGTGGPGYTLPPEIRLKHVTGAVAMARLGDKINPTRRSNGSQFFICLKPMPEYDSKYTVFGKVIDGMDVLEKISEMPVDSNDNLLSHVEIDSVKIKPREKVRIPAETPKPKKTAEKRG